MNLSPVQPVLRYLSRAHKKSQNASVSARCYDCKIDVECNLRAAPRRRPARRPLPLRPHWCAHRSRARASVCVLTPRRPLPLHALLDTSLLRFLVCAVRDICTARAGPIKTPCAEAVCYRGSCFYTHWNILCGCGVGYCWYVKE